MYWVTERSRLFLLGKNEMVQKCKIVIFVREREGDPIFSWSVESTDFTFPEKGTTPLPKTPDRNPPTAATKHPLHNSNHGSILILESFFLPKPIQNQHHRQQQHHEQIHPPSASSFAIAQKQKQLVEIRSALVAVKHQAIIIIICCC